MAKSNSRRGNFTKAFIGALEPEAKVYDVHDTKQHGLCLRVRPTGLKKFMVYMKVDGVPQRQMIGPFPDVTVETARDQAAKIIGQVAQGENPFDQRKKKRAEMTVGVLQERFIEKYSKPRKRTWKRDVKLYELHLKPHWHTKKLSAITRVEILERHESIGKDTPIQANRVLSLISKMMVYAQSIGVGPESNPCRGIEKYPETERQRYLTNEEIAKFFAALDEEPNQVACDYFRLSLFAGARRSNMLAMRWDELDLDSSTWHIKRTKTGKPLKVHLTPEAMVILQARKLFKEDSPWVFPSYGSSGHLVEPKKVWKRVCDAAELEDFRIHDLRHSYASFLANGGASLLVLQKAMGHLTLASTKRYAHLILDTVRGVVDDSMAKVKKLASKGKTPPETAQQTPTEPFEVDESDGGVG